jgi:hypothetical protein
LINNNLKTEAYQLIKTSSCDTTLSGCDSTNFIKAWIYYSFHDLDSAITYFDQIDKTSTLHRKSLYFNTLSKAHNGDYAKAMSDFSADNDTSELHYFVGAGLSLLNNDWDSYNKNAVHFTYDNYALAEHEITLSNIYQDAILHKQKKAWVAGMASAIIPGLGKIYAGSIGEGISSFLLVGSFAAITAENWMKNGMTNWKTILFGAIGSIFYIGNIYGSVASVKLYHNDFEQQKTFPFFILFTFLFAPYLIKAQSNKADSLYNLQQYYSAALEYEREIFKGSSINSTNQVLLNKANCYKQAGNYEEAANNLNRVKVFALKPSERGKYFYDLAFNSYLCKNHTKAYDAIQMFDLSDTTSAYCHNMHLLKLLVLNELCRWDDSFEAAQQYISLYKPNDSLAKAATTTSFASAPKLKNMRKAKILSVIPGLGQCYAGYPAEGLYSFTLNAAALTFGIFEIINGCYVTAYLGGAGMLSSTYFGNIGRVEYLVNKKNHELSQQFNQQIRSYILSFWREQ